MIVPHDDKYGKRPKPGDKVTVTTQINRDYYIITVGHVLTYMGEDPQKNPGSILKDEESGLIVTSVSILDYAMYAPDIETAKKNYVDKKEKEKFMELIDKQCLFRNRYGPTHECKFVGGVCNNYMDISCIEHISEEDYENEPFYFNYIRKMKLRKIEDETVQV